MAASTTTTRPTTTTTVPGACVAEYIRNDGVCDMMNTHWFSFTALYQHYRDCAKGKRHSSIEDFALQAEKRLVALSHVLKTRQYTPRMAQAFVVEKPKCREVVASSFQDRIVHRVLVSQLNRIFEPSFIAHSYACRAGKGTHQAITTVAKVLKVRQQYKQPNHLLHLDIHNFFLSINHHILWQILEQKIHKHYTHHDISTMPDLDELLWLTKTILEASRQVSASQHNHHLPPHKQLSQQPLGVGLPIGNYASQLFGNIYLDQLDQWVKHHLKVKHYYRYCDDILLISDSVNQLQHHHQQIESYLTQRLALKLNPDYGQIITASCGVDYLGYRIFPSHILVRKRVIDAFKQRLSQCYLQLVHPSDQAIHYRYSAELLQKLQATLHSFLAHIRWAHHFSLCQQLWRQFAWLSVYFCFNPKAGAYTRFRLRYPLRFAQPRFVQQLAMLKAIASHYVLVVQMGNRFVRYQPKTSAQGAMLVVEKNLPTLAAPQRIIKTIIHYKQGVTS
jgi:RNA-directed DNA polymerase